MTTITITDNIWARVDGNLSDVDRLLRYKMPGFQFSPAGKRGWDGWISMGKWDGMSLVIPAGLVPYVKQQPFAQTWEVIDQRIKPEFKPMYADKELGQLEPHQLDAVEKAIAAARGVVRYPTGTGKGRILGEIIRRLGLRTLVIVDKVDLVKQLGDEIALCIGRSVGRVGGGKHEYQDCTVATYQTLAKGRTPEFWQEWEAVLVDEGHHTEAKTFGQTLQQLTKAYYRLAFSATPFKGGERKTHDPTYLKVQAWLGPPVATMSLTQGIETGRIVPADIFIVQVPARTDVGFKRRATNMDVYPPVDYWRCSKHGRLISAEGCNCPVNYREEYEAQTVLNGPRNDLIIKLARKLRTVGATVVLVQRLEHGQTLADGIGCTFIHGSTKDRASYYEEFKQGMQDTCLVISPIADEGLDLPNIEYLIMAGGGKADHRQIQRLGRGMRASAGKDRLTAFDFTDEGVHTASHYRRRRRLYEREPAYTVIDLDAADLEKWGVK